MAWSKLQQRLFNMAASAAGCNDRLRWSVMLHAGCRCAKRPQDGMNRPSIKDPANTQDQYELCMAVFESQAKAAGRRVPVPGGRRASWAEAARDIGSRVRDKCLQIAREAAERMPDEFAADLAWLDAFVVRQTMHDDTRNTGVPFKPRKLIECDEGQLYRVLEGLKPWIARKLAERGMRPFSYKSPLTDEAFQMMAARGPQKSTELASQCDGLRGEHASPDA